MDSIHIHGGVGLQGKVKIQGSKNGALPVLAAAVLTGASNMIYNCPRIADVYHMLQLLQSIGCLVGWEGDGVRVDASKVNLSKMPADAITGMRSSLCLMGVLLGRAGEISMEYPGGCVIGERPIDLHLSALRQMGATFYETEGQIRGRAKNGLKGAHIHLALPSVGATENIILAAVLAEGETIIDGAAREPEVEILCDYLKHCGAGIKGAGTNRLHIQGGQKLYGADFMIPADRVVAGTYLYACLATRGSVLLEGAPIKHMESVIDVARSMGAECQIEKENLYIQSPENLRQISLLKTEAYPGFPTDLQSIVLAVLTRVKGQCLIYETIFENRFRVTGPLRTMGAKVITLDDRRTLVSGPVLLRGREVDAKELRGGAALIIAGLMAEGETIIRGCQYINRGYVNIIKDLRELGARIYSV